MVIGFKDKRKNCTKKEIIFRTFDKCIALMISKTSHSIKKFPCLCIFPCVSFDLDNGRLTCTLTLARIEARARAHTHRPSTCLPSSRKWLNHIASEARARSSTVPAQANDLPCWQSKISKHRDSSIERLSRYRDSSIEWTAASVSWPAEMVHCFLKCFLFLFLYFFSCVFFSGRRLFWLK